MQTTPFVKAVAATATALILSAGFSLPAQASASASATSNPIDTNSRAAVSNAYKSRWLPTTSGTAGWNGSVATCNKGTQTSASLAKGAAAVNFYRGLNRLDSVTLDSTQNQKAQAAALIMEANDTLTHYPTSGMKCYTELGRQGAGTSNLYLNWTTIPSMANAVQTYMDDPGDSNKAAGHRRWLLNPTTTTMGFGTTDTANAINVIGGGSSIARAQPTFISLPNAGYSPQQLEPDGRWSLSSSSSDYDFTSSTIVVKNSAGTVIPVTKYPVANGYGPNTVVFQLSGVKYATGTGVENYTVTVANIKYKGTSVTHTYTTRLFDGNSAGTPTPTFASAREVAAVDSSGVLWNYHEFKTPRTRVGSGWQVMDSVNVIDWNKDGITDILAKDKSGALWFYKGLAGGGLSRTALGSAGWQGYDIDVAKWKKTDTYPSVIAKNKSTGDLFLYPNASAGALSPRVKIGAGWKYLDLNLLDWDKDGAMDVVAKNSSGEMKLYRTNGSGVFLSEARKTIGGGWNVFNSITTVRNFQGSATDGLLARDSSGNLFHYRTGSGAWQPRVQVGAGWNSYKIGNN